MQCPYCSLPLDESATCGPLDSLKCEHCGGGFRSLGKDSTRAADSKETLKLEHFKLLTPVGQGHFGVVWKALDTNLDRIVALKVPREDWLSESEHGMVLREARAAARFQHPNIVTVHEVRQESGVSYIVSDFVEGVTLADWMTSHRMSARQSTELCIKIADALHHAHNHGVVHRDLKPSNILLDVKGEPHVTDFGLAKRDAGEATLTSEGDIVGTPAYMSPEQARGQGHEADCRSDIYSLGVIFFELLTGERPFRGNSRMLIQQVIHDEPPSPRKFTSAIPRDLETICLKCLEKSPERRYVSAEDVSRDLRNYLQNRPIKARPVSAPERAIRWCRRYPLATTLIAVILLSLGIVTGLWLRTRQAEHETQQHLKAAIRERERRGENFEKAIASIENMLSRILERDNPKLDQVQVAVLQDALDLYEELIEPAETDPTLFTENARVYVRMGNLLELLSRTDDAESSYQEAINQFQRALQFEPEAATQRQELAECHRSLGSLIRSRANTPRIRKRALASAEKALELDQALVKEHKDQVEFLQALARDRELLASIYRKDQRHAECKKQWNLAGELWDQCVKLDPKWRLKLAKAWCDHNLADYLMTRGQLDSAQSLHEGALAQRLLLLEEVKQADGRGGDYAYYPSGVVHVPDPRMRFSLNNDIAASYRSLGNIFERNKKPELAIRHFRDALAYLELVIERFPKRDTHLNAISGIHGRLGATKLQLPEAKQTNREAYNHYQTAITYREQISSLRESEPELSKLANQLRMATNLAKRLDDQTGLSDYAARLVRTNQQRILLIEQMGELERQADKISKILQQNETLISQLLASDEESREFMVMRAQTRLDRGRLLAGSEDYRSAELALRESISDWFALTQRYAQDREVSEALEAASRVHLDTIRASPDQFQINPAYREVCEVYGRMVRADDLEPETRSVMAYNNLQLALLLEKTDPRQALTSCQHAIDGYDRIDTRMLNPHELHELSNALSCRAHCLLQRGDSETAEESLRDAILQLKELTRDSKNEVYAEALATRSLELASLLLNEPQHGQSADGIHERTAEAISLTKLATQHHAQSSRAWRLAGRALFAAQTYSPAAEAFEQARKLEERASADNVETWLHLAICYWHTNQPQKARDYMQRVEQWQRNNELDSARQKRLFRDAERLLDGQQALTEPS